MQPPLKNVIATDTTAIKLTRNSGTDVITGNFGNDTLATSSGSDTLIACSNVNSVEISVGFTQLMTAFHVALTANLSLTSGLHFFKVVRRTGK